MSINFQEDSHQVIGNPCEEGEPLAGGRLTCSVNIPFSCPREASCVQGVCCPNFGFERRLAPHPPDPKHMLGMPDDHHDNLPQRRKLQYDFKFSK